MTDELSAFCDDALPAQRARQVEAHLRSCDRCRLAYEEIRLGVAACREISRVSAPEALWDRIEAGASAVPAPRTHPWVRTAARAAVVILAVLVGLGIWALGFRERLEIVAASEGTSAFEEVARDAHARRVAGSLEFDYATASPEALRTWLENAGFDVSLAIHRPTEDGERFRVVGAKVVKADGARAALVGYEIDARPVTLLTAALREVAHPPPDSHFGKSVTYRSDAEHGVKLLTWGADGQAYVLVSDLPGHGTEACSICHTSPVRRELIRKAARTLR